MQSVYRKCESNATSATWRIVRIQSSGSWLHALLKAGSIVFICAAAIWSGHIGAQPAQLRLGNPEVLSSLGSPLWVKIPIAIDSTESAGDISASRFSLGAKPPNAPVPFVERGEISVERAGDKYLLLIRSRDAIDEPAVGIVLRESLPNGVRSREFFLLLDPAPLNVATATDQNREPVASDANAPLTQPAQIVAPAKISQSQSPALTTATADKSPLPRKRISRRDQAGARKSTLADTAAPAAARRGKSNISRIAESNSAWKKRSLASSAQTEGGPRLKLSFGEGLTTRPATTEAERADIRMRQFTLDMDDLTSGLLERQHKIGQLEKELASLTARVSAAERLISAGPQTAVATAPTPAPAPPVAVVPATAPAIEPPPTATVINTPAPEAPSVSAKTRETKSVQSPANATWSWAVTAAALLAALCAVIWGIRHLIRRRDQDYRLTGQRAEEYVAEVLSQTHKTTYAAVVKPVDSSTPLTPLPTPVKSVAKAYSPPEIHFELPELPPLPDAIITPPDEVVSTSHVVTNVVRKPADEATSRRMRYLQSRYQDIAILMPPLDAPQRLLRQAATVYDEGATDFAKRLLKYGAYSRPYTEEFWLALLELLYREKFASDYVVNTKWFRQYHPESSKWDEVLRIGYLLDPLEPLFAVAVHWSHEEPMAGVWLPSDPGDKKPVAPPPHLTLEVVP